MYTFSKVEDSISIKFCDGLQSIKTNYLFKKFNQFKDFPIMFNLPTQRTSTIVDFFFSQFQFYQKVNFII